MGSSGQNAITPTRDEDYPEWYQQVIKASDLAERSPVRGCMVIKPWGYALWENIVRVLDDMFKATGVKNAYFPLFIPLSFLEKEAEHVEGFAKECAVVTHHRLEKEWQEGHTAHSTKEEAIERTKLMLEVYARMAEDYLAMPVIRGAKSAAERFPGAVDTLCIEAMMQDRKALQAGTSHFLGQNFARASEIKFQTAQETEDYVWTTSWGASTRLIGGVIMSHGDDDGIILPPKVASAQVVLLPIIRKANERENVMTYTEKLANRLKDTYYHHRKLVVEVDDRDIGGARGWEWIKKGIPLRVEIGPRDIARNCVFVARRDKPHNEKKAIDIEQFVGQITHLLDEIQDNLYRRAETFRQAHTVAIDDRQAFYDFFTPQNSEKPEIHGGFALSSWCGEQACELKIKEDLAVTIRCIPFEQGAASGPCICCGRPGQSQAVFAKAY
ncbi:MAG: His/Gly/Thr/Pro-type tRNA ligase C-terminal domain-containing protein [Desulfobacterales bacterium]